MLLKSIKNSVLSIGKSIDNPIFIKDFNDENLIVDELLKMKEIIKDEYISEKINRDIIYLNTGLIGEKNVYYELKNSFLPIVCLHDLYIKHEDYEAQIDFLIISNKFVCILETKKLSGDILVNNKGDFIRKIKNSKGKIIKEEGIYSPITQNERHMRIVKDILIKNKIIKNCPVFSRVVIANQKSIVNTRYAPKNVKQQLIKYDQISSNLRELIVNTNDVDMAYKTIMDIAQFLINKHENKKEHYILAKYKDTIAENKDTNKYLVEYENEETNVNTPTINKDQIINDLKKYRLDKSRQENIKPYYIFSNKQMEELIEKMPKSKDELIKISGFGEVKSEKYGDEIINIIINNN